MVYADLACSRDSRMFRDLVMKPSSFSPPVIPARHRVTRLNEGSTRSAWKTQKSGERIDLSRDPIDPRGLLISHDGSSVFFVRQNDPPVEEC